MTAGLIETTGPGQASGHAHGHGHGPAHHHGPGHDHAAHAPGPSLRLPTPAPAPVASLLMSSALLRLAGAIGIGALLWTAVVWALSGTP